MKEEQFLSYFGYGIGLSQSYHEYVGVGMCLDIVNVGLLQISQVAEAHFGISYRQVDGEHLSQDGLMCREVNLLLHSNFPKRISRNKIVRSGERTSLP